MYLTTSRKLHIRRNSNKVDSIETGRMVIDYLLQFSKLLVHHPFQNTDNKILSSLLGLYIQLYLFAYLNDLFKFI